MYIPAWLIIGAIIIGIYYFARATKYNNLNNNMSNIFKQRSSYKLEVQIGPNWYHLYKKLFNPKSEKEWEKSLEDKIKKSEKDDGSFNLWGRRYVFIEYYDSASGLTTRFQRVLYQNGKKDCYPVDEFGESGYVFESDGEYSIRDNEEKRAETNRLSIEIGEDFIRNDIFDKYIGGPKSGFDYEKENYLFQFPLFQVFSFLFALGQRFHGTERNTIIKWPTRFGGLSLKKQRKVMRVLNQARERQGRRGDLVVCFLFYLSKAGQDTPHEFFCSQPNRFQSLRQLFAPPPRSCIYFPSFYFS